MSTCKPASSEYGVDSNAFSIGDADTNQGCCFDKVPLDRGKNVRFMTFTRYSDGSDVVSFSIRRLTAIRHGS